jgi:16S rRNA A1518/A1519 N6-dimethyltransferase RsmA/KsgA/DIM1 with predicted DNA glycosylase/AP lyase activity
MPQETKSMPVDPEAMEVAPGVEHENLEGWIPQVENDRDLCMALEKAFDYRGDITLTLKDGSKVEGYVFDRRSEGRTLDDCVVRLFPKDRHEKVSVRYSEIARLEFSGRDTAAGKSFETWLKKYQEKKAAGEKNIRIEPEALD